MAINCCHTGSRAVFRRILEAAHNRLIAEGYEAFVPRELADGLDMKLGNLQYYFKTKEVLVHEVMRLEGEKDVLVVRHQLSSSDTPESALEGVTTKLVSRWRSRSGSLLSTLGTLSLHNNKFRQLYREIYLDFYEALEELLADLNPALSPNDVRLRTRLITALIDGSAMQIRADGGDDYLKEVNRQARLLALQPPA